jgi:hypothetical protein
MQAQKAKMFKDRCLTAFFPYIRQARSAENLMTAIFIKLDPGTGRQ